VEERQTEVEGNGSRAGRRERDGGKGLQWQSHESGSVAVERLSPGNGETVQNQSGSQSLDISQLKRSKYVESTLILPDMTTTADIRAIQGFLHSHRYLPEKIRAFYPNLPSRSIKIEHDPNLISASTVAEALKRFSDASSSNEFTDVIVHVDGAVEGLALPESISDSDADDIDIGTTTWMGNGISSMLRVPKGLHWNVFFSGFFWVVSMLGVVVSSWCVASNEPGLYVHTSTDSYLDELTTISSSCLPLQLTRLEIS